MLQGRPNQMTGAGRDLLPELGDVHTLVLASTAFLVFAGVEQSAAHAGDVARPGRDYPRAILLATVIVLALIVPATLAISVVVPAKQLSLVGGLSEAFTAMFAVYDLQWMARVMAVLIVAGLVVQIQVLFNGPDPRASSPPAAAAPCPARCASRTATRCRRACSSCRPRSARVLAGLFLLLPSVNGVYWIFTALQTQLVLLMYVLMYATVVQLRRTQPQTPRALPRARRVGRSRRRHRRGRAGVRRRRRHQPAAAGPARRAGRVGHLRRGPHRSAWWSAASSRCGSGAAGGSPRRRVAPTVRT